MNFSMKEPQNLTYHWWHQKKKNNANWKPFSLSDNKKLDDAYLKNYSGIVTTDGGRYNTSVKNRRRTSIYWQEQIESHICRAGWYKRRTLNEDFQPYGEFIEVVVEHEYRRAYATRLWNCSFVMENNREVTFYSSNQIGEKSVSHGGGGEIILKRNVQGIKLFELPQDESTPIDYLVFVVPGINSGKGDQYTFDCMDKFRDLTLTLMKQTKHAKFAGGTFRRIEYLPVSWDKGMLSGASKMEADLHRVKLPNNPVLREYTVDSMLDVLLYNGGTYSKPILNSTVDELNRMYRLFRERNPGFTGGISLIGHSLGSVILFDILSVQTAELVENDPSIVEFLTKSGLKEHIPKFVNKSTIDLMPYEFIDYKKMKLNDIESFQCKSQFHHSNNNYVKKLIFKPENLFVIGSPIAIFLITRGKSFLGPDFKLPTCNGFYNIFHSCDPSSFRIEPIICDNVQLKCSALDVNLGKISDEVIASLGIGIKELFSSTFSKSLKPFSDNNLPEGTGDSLKYGKKCGSLNHNGRRVDFLLKPSLINIVSEYLSSIKSHTNYWLDQIIS